MSNMSNCKACGKEIAKGVKKCVHCGKDQRNFFMKHKVLTVIVGVVVIVGISSALGGNKSKSTSTDSGSVTSSDEKKEEVKEFYGVNEDVKLGDALVKVTKVDKSNGSEYDKPKDGMEFVTVTVNIKNLGDKEISYNPVDFKMQNSKGQINDETFTTIDHNTALNYGKLTANGEVSGTVTFEQPKDDKELVLKYKGNLFSSKEVKIKLN